MTADPTWTPAITALAASGRAPSTAAIRELVDAQDTRLGGLGVQRERQRLEARLLGLGPLTDLVRDPRVTDVLVNGDGRVWVDRGEGVSDTGTIIPVGETRSLAVRLAGLAGRRLDDAQPWVDGLLPSGVRLHAILPPLVVGGAHVSLRVPRVAPHGIPGLVSIGALGEAGAALVRRIIDERLTFVVVGGTGTGKTTFVGGLLGACPPADRIVIVEDVRELAPHHPHVVHLQGRAPNVEGAGGVSMVDLVRQSLRMRPDRLVVGEVRGAEVRELLAALNTGHRGGGGTMHANSIHDAPSRIEALGALAGLTARAVSTQVLGGLHVVLGMERLGPVRRLADVGVVTAGSGGRATVVPAVDVRGHEPVALEGACLLEARLAGRFDSP